MSTALSLDSGDTTVQAARYRNMRSQKLLRVAEAANPRHENPVLLTFARTARHALSVISILFTVAVLPAAAQTWTGNTSGLWTNPGNWSPAGTPVSSTSTQLIFEKTSHAVMTNDIPGTMSLNSMTFNLGSNAYSLSGNALKVGSITTNSTQS